jgi:hypothetical protein
VDAELVQSGLLSSELERVARGHGLTHGGGLVAALLATAGLARRLSSLPAVQGGCAGRRSRPRKEPGRTGLLSLACAVRRDDHRRNGRQRSEATDGSLRSPEPSPSRACSPEPA